MAHLLKGGQGGESGKQGLLLCRGRAGIREQGAADGCDCAVIQRERDSAVKHRHIAPQTQGGSRAAAGFVQSEHRLRVGEFFAEVPAQGFRVPVGEGAGNVKAAGIAKDGGAVAAAVGVNAAALCGSLGDAAEPEHGDPLFKRLLPDQGIGGQLRIGRDQSGIQRHPIRGKKRHQLLLLGAAGGVFLRPTNPQRHQQKGIQQD